MAIDTEEMRRLIKRLDVIAWREAIRVLTDEVDELRAQLAQAKSQLRGPNYYDTYNSPSTDD